MAHSPAAEFTIDEDGVRRLLHSDVPHFADLPLKRIAEGWDNVTWRLGTDLAVRLPRRRRALELIRHEQQALPVLAPRLAAIGVRTPLPVHIGAPSSEFPWPWSVVPWIEGVPALDRAMSGNATWAARLARALDALHQTTTAAPHNPVRGIPLAQRDERIRRFLDELERPLGDALTQIWEEALRAPAATERVWIHGDLHPGNIVLHGDDLAGLIDFGDVTAGDPSYDLAIAWEAFDSRGRDTFRATTGDRYDGATWVRARGWAAAIAAILLSQSDDRAEYRALGARTATEVLRG